MPTSMPPPQSPDTGPNERNLASRDRSPPAYPDAVDSRTAHDRDPPAAVGAGAEQRKRVVADDEPFGPVLPLDATAQRGQLLGQIDAGEQDLRGRGERTLERAEARLQDRAVKEILEHLDAAVDSEVVGLAPPAAHERQQLTASIEQREVGLDAAPVDREHEPVGGHDRARDSDGRPSAASIRSLRVEAKRYSRTSGCASSASRAAS